MHIWRNEHPDAWRMPPGHFGGLKATDIVPFEGRDFAVQIAVIPPGGGGELHHHETWSQVFYIVEGQMTFETGQDRFELVAGESVLFEPMDPHHTLNEGRGDTLALVFTVKHDGARQQS